LLRLTERRSAEKEAIMILSHSSKLAVTAVLCALATAPAALAGPSHQTPVQKRAKHAVTHNVLTSGAWTPMIDESRADAPFNRITDYADALARFLDRR
jgi:hypothetical protein